MGYLNLKKFAIIFNHANCNFISCSITQKPVQYLTINMAVLHRCTDTKHCLYCLSICALNQLVKLLNFFSLRWQTNQTDVSDLSYNGLQRENKRFSSLSTADFKCCECVFGQRFYRIVRLFVAIGGFCSSHEIHFIIFIQNSCGKQN